MAIFDGFADVSGQLDREGETITLTFSPGLPVTGQGTVQWNIPGPAQGCQVASDGRGAYCGILILLSTTPLTAANIPVDGTFYTNDPTANPDLHVGDSINGALVVGAFYEGEKRSRGEDLSTSLIISDLTTNTPYYVAGYAVDCQGRYHHDGVRAYSDSYGNTDVPDSPSIQTALMNSGEGVQLTDGTNLIPGVIYEFDIEINEDFPNAAAPEDIINVKIDGINAQTYQDLLDVVNNQLSLAENPPISPIPPFTGSYYVDTASAVFKYNGTTYDSITALFEPTDPSIISTGTYWYNPTASVLQQWDTPTVAVWNLVDIIKYHKDPTILDCNDYWFTGTLGYNWNGSTWCELPTLVDAVDPSLAPTLLCGTFWYDEANLILSEWDTDQLTWKERTAIFWDEAPNALSNGTYWFDLATSTVNLRSAGSWAAQTTAIIAVVAPVAPLPAGQLWFNPTTEELKEWNNTTMLFEDRDILVWSGDPTIISTCDLWWDSVTNDLNTWDVVNSEWDEVVSFIESTIDPQLAPVIAIDTLWYNTVDTLFQWDGNDWASVTFIEFATDPTAPPTGTGWLNTSTGVWSIWDTPTASSWNVINPIDIDTDPTTIAAGTFWYDQTLNILYERIGAAWVAIPFTTSPITHKKGDTWFDSTLNILNQWNGSSWVAALSKVTLSLDAKGNLVFTSRAAGSCACTMLLVPGQTSQYPYNNVSTGYADFHSAGHYNSYSSDSFHPPAVPKTFVTEAAFLFNNLPSQILPQRYGIDGLSGKPMYDIIGVGNDGTPDERRELIESIKAQLGYPVVDVELTLYQLNEAVQSAIESLRKRSDIAYKRGFYFLDVKPGYQQYQLTNKKAGFHKIVTVMQASRMTSAFLSAAQGAGVYGQIVLQHLYNMGTYDLTSFHLVAQYIETMEHLFATRIVFHWNESSRILHLHQSFGHPERLLLDCSVEKTEQELFKDRWCKTWIEKFALAQSRYMLAEIRGKYASLPGAGGGVSLNASDLVTRADQDIADLYQQLDDFIASNVEDWGMGTTFLIG